MSTPVSIHDGPFTTNTLVILGMGSFTKINQRLEQDFIHFGRPAKKWKKTEIILY